MEFSAGDEEKEIRRRGVRHLAERNAWEGLVPQGEEYPRPLPPG
jgi:hypothetical protein